MNNAERGKSPGLWLGDLFLLRNRVLPLLVFLSLLPLLAWFNNQTLRVQGGTPFITGIATFDNVDIQARIRIYYGALSIFILCFILLGSGFYYLFRSGRLNATRLAPWQYIGGWGIFLLVLKLNGTEHRTDMELLGAVSVCLFLWQLLKARAVLPAPLKSVYFFLCLCLSAFSMSIFFIRLLRAVGIAEDQAAGIPFFAVFLFGVLLYAAVAILVLKKGRPLAVFLKSSIPLLFFAHLSVLSDELYMSAGRQGPDLFLPDTLFFAGSTVLVLCSVCLLLFPGRLLRPALYLRRWAFPVLLSGIGCLAFYQPFIEQSSDMFELANPANGVMRLFRYGELPVADALPSHVLSDIGFKPLYVLLNGYTGTLDFFIYDFVYPVLLLLLLYYFLRRVSGSALFAFAFVLWQPYVFPYVQLGHAIWAVLPLLAVLQMGDRPSLRRFLGLLFLLLFLVLWRIDVGISAGMATLALLCVKWAGSPVRRQFLLRAVAAGGIVAAVLLAAFTLLYIRNPELYTNLLSAGDYFGAAQAHGLTHLAHHTGRLFYLHYYIFPVLVALLLLLTLFLIFRPVRESGDKVLLPVLLFLIVYYFANAQRGLVRHSFIEENEFHISSFFYVIVALFLFRVLRAYKDALFYTAVLFTLTVYCFSVSEGKGFYSLYHSMSCVAEAPPVIDPAAGPSERVRGSSRFAGERYAGLKAFMEQNLPPEATFIDLSNSPMLYFYTGRRVPSYFNQYLQNTVTDRLLQRNLRKLETLDVPLAVFSSVPETWFDMTDGVPNTLRYRPVTSHVYRYYEPYAVIDHYYIWKKKGLVLPEPDSLQADTGIIRVPRVYDVRHYPALAAASPLNSRLEYVPGWIYQAGILKDTLTFEQKNSTWLQLEFEQVPYEQTVSMYYFSGNDSLGGFRFFIYGGEEARRYLLPAGIQYNWMYYPVTAIRFRDSNGHLIRPKSVHLFREKTW